jgi:AcrR family transcriptional regulator
LLRVELINAAVRVLLREEDAAALTLSGVAREAGVSAPSIYRHFENRERRDPAAVRGAGATP